MFLSIVSSVRLSSVIMSSTPLGPKARSSPDGGFAMAHHLQPRGRGRCTEREQWINGHTAGCASRAARGVAKCTISDARHASVMAQSARDAYMAGLGRGPWVASGRSYETTVSSKGSVSLSAHRPRPQCRRSPKRRWSRLPTASCCRARLASFSRWPSVRPPSRVAPVVRGEAIDAHAPRRPCAPARRFDSERHRPRHLP